MYTPGVPANHPKLSTLGDLPQIAPLGLGKNPIFKISLYICQINLDLLETLNLSSWGTNQTPQVGEYPNFKDLPISLYYTLNLSSWVGHLK